jgi:hypothetical protein
MGSITSSLICLLGSSHYKMYIISSVGHPKSDSIMLLVLWTIAYNGQGTNIVLQVPRNKNKILSNSFELENIQLVIVNGIFVPSKSEKTKLPLHCN